VPADDFRRRLCEIHQRSAAMYERLAVLNAQSASACLSRGWLELAALHVDNAERNRQMARLARERVRMHMPPPEESTVPDTPEGLIDLRDDAASGLTGRLVDRGRRD
jgi:hypothetical protein